MESDFPFLKRRLHNVIGIAELANVLGCAIYACLLLMTLPVSSIYTTLPKIAKTCSMAELVLI